MRKINLIGKKFGKLVVIKEYGKTNAGHSQWECKCNCGNFVIRTGTSIKRSINSNCGCVKKKHLVKIALKRIY